MAFKNPSLDTIYHIIRETHTLAVVGLSPKSDRPSHGVAKALQDLGFRIIPVRPGVETILGESAYAELSDIPPAVRDEVDLVQIFRRSEHAATHVDQCIELGFKRIWMQDGVVDEAAAERAVKAGLTVVMDRCFYRDRISLMQQAGWAP